MPRVMSDADARTPPIPFCGRCGVRLMFTIEELVRLRRDGGVTLCVSCAEIMEELNANAAS